MDISIARGASAAAGLKGPPYIHLAGNDEWQPCTRQLQFGGVNRVEFLAFDDGPRDR